MTTYTQRDIGDAVRYLAANPNRIHGPETYTPRETAALRAMASRDWRMVLVAALRECARPSPSWPDVAAAINRSHTAALADWERWSALPWRDRCNWLDLVERVAFEMQSEDSKCRQHMDGAGSL
jgi:hypothetical protein